jgi:hypothetical protein
MTITQDQLKASAERCGMKHIAGPYWRRSDEAACAASLDWLLTPDGRDAMEKAIIAEGGDVTTSYDCYEPLHWLAYITVPNPKPAAIPYMESSARSADSPAAALVLAICGLPKVQP